MSDKNASPVVGICDCGNEQILGYSDSYIDSAKKRTCSNCGKRIAKLALSFNVTINVHAGMKLKAKSVKHTGKRKLRREIESGHFQARDGSGKIVSKYLDRDRDNNWYKEVIDGKIIRNKPLNEHKGHGIDEKSKKSRP